MPLSSYWMHNIYIEETMNYGLGSDDPEDLAQYNKIRKEMDDIKKQPIRKRNFSQLGFPKKWINKIEYFFIN